MTRRGRGARGGARRAFERVRAPVFAAISTLAITGCPSFDRGAETPAADAFDAARPNAMQCFNCHTRGQVFDARAAEGGTLIAAYRTLNGGLKLSTPLVPGDVDHYAFDVVSRGRHPASLDREDCWSCHPVGADGTGHGQRIFPVADPFAPGIDCAGACHEWLQTSVREAGPGGVAYAGTLRPAELLAAANNPHAAIWRGGFRRTDATEKDFLVAAIAPGCGGCHAIEDVSHGATPSCLSCHVWDGPEDRNGPHARHQEYINLVGGPAPRMESDCGWCHGFGAPDAPELARPACYNCHLSGHAPRNEDGDPQLWR